jgi:hypothetical protein
MGLCCTAKTAAIAAAVTAGAAWGSATLHGVNLHLHKLVADAKCAGQSVSWVFFKFQDVELQTLRDGSLGGAVFQPGICH